MKQISSSETEFAAKRMTRRERFLADENGFSRGRKFSD